MTHFDLVIIGTGSGNSIPGPEFDDKSIAIVEDGLFGGTCLNAGCIPTKMFVHPADLADGIRDAGRLGVTGRVDSVDWPGMRNRIFGRIDAIEAGGRAYRTGPETPNITVFAGRGKFVGPKELRVTLHDGSTTTITGEQWVLAAGSRPVIPDIPGLSEVDFHTSDSIMRLADLPASVTILGGGYIAAEFAHVFASFGCEVTQVVRGPALLRSHDADISAAFTAAASRRYRVLTDCRINKISRSNAPGGGITLDITRPEGPVTVTSQVLLVATGRIPNGADLGVEATGVDLDEDGLVVVDEYQRTKVPGIYALGDISSRWALKHVANHEARVVKHNLAQPDSLLAADHRFVPAAVFTHPQIASVGPTERQLKESGRPYAVKTQAYGDIAAGWAREDTENFLKVLGDPVTGKLLGAHVIGPEAATVIQPLIQAMHFDQTAHQVARGQYWIHPALTELVENALLGLPDPTYSDQV